MNTEIKLKDYFQLGNHESQNKFIAGEDDEEILPLALNEFWDESKPGSGTDKVVTGIEEYNNKTLSRQTAKFFSLSDPDTFSKNASKMNYVLGAEGFISNTMEFIKEIIEKIVKFIMGGVKWLIESGKSLLGLSQNAERREKQAKDVINIQKDLMNYLRTVGFPESLLSLDNFVEHLSPDFSESFKLIHYDSAHAKEHLDTLDSTTSSLNDLRKEMAKRSLFISKTQTRLKDKIIKMYKDLKAPKPLDLNVYRDLVAEIQGAILELDYKRWETRMMAIVERHYKKANEGIAEVQNPEYAVGLNSVKTAIENIRAKLQEAEPQQLMKSAMTNLEGIASVRNKPSRNIDPIYISLDFDKLGKGGAEELRFIENSVNPGGNLATNSYLSYVSEVAKYVTLTKEISSMIQTCIAEQQVYFNFYIKLGKGVADFIDGGIEAFVNHVNTLNSNLPKDKRFKSTGKNIFQSDEVADSFLSQMNHTLETLHDAGDLLQVKTRVNAFKKQMAG